MHLSAWKRERQSFPALLYFFPCKIYNPGGSALMKRSVIPLLLLLLAVGCQMVSPPPPPEPVVLPAPVQTWVERLQTEAVTLPAAQVTIAPGSVTIAYPQESLFSTGSVLPLVGGAEASTPSRPSSVLIPKLSGRAKFRRQPAMGLTTIWLWHKNGVICCNAICVIAGSRTAGCSGRQQAAAASPCNWSCARFSRRRGVRPG